MDLATIDPSDYGRLIGFYQERIKILEGDKIELLSQLESQKMDVVEKHKREWTDFRMTNEKDLLDKELTEFRLQFYQVKSKLIETENENKELKERLACEEKKVQQLVEHVQPVAEEIRLKEGKKPKFHYKFIKTSSGLNSMKQLKEKYVPQLPADKFTLQSKVIIETEGGEQPRSTTHTCDPKIYDTKYFNKIRLLENEN